MAGTLIKMKAVLLLIITVLNFSDSLAQTIFKLVEAKGRNSGEATVFDNADKYYKIVLVNDSLDKNFSYPLITEKYHIDTLGAIEELLSLKGNERICTLPIMSYNPLRSQIYMGPNKNYSIQVEALFIINQLIFERPFVYSSYPVLVNKVNNLEASVSGEIIDKAFEAYRSWYMRLKEIGVQEIKYRKIMPLDGTSVKWY
ncbi:hypothetical protein ACTJJB_05510 [Chitinophaga sp. 22536]|uniref:hypothetical protein n=1 Tax=unclassified Chitinophaga TaxID=2619133 RepID=UPI003F8381A2